MSTVASNITLPPPSGIKDKTLDEIEPLQGRRIAIVGPPGAGKSWLAATWPRPAFIDADHKIASLKQTDWQTYAGKPANKHIVAISQPHDIRNKKGIVEKPQGYWQVLEKFNEWSERDDIQTIVGDSLTSISTMAMALGVHVSGIDKRSKTKAEAMGTPAKEGHGVLLFTEADFGAEMSVIEQLMESLPQISQTVIFTCHVRTEYNDNGSLLGYKPLITGNKHRESMGRWFHEVWWLEVRGVGANAYRVLQTRSDNLHQFLNTTMGLPHTIERPTYDSIVAAHKMTQQTGR